MDAFQAIAALWSARHPELAPRLERALGLVGGVVRGRFPHVFFVGGSEGASYIVRVNRKARTSTCTCSDHKFRGGRCKHILAAAIYEKGVS